MQHCIRISTDHTFPVLSRIFGSGPTIAYHPKAAHSFLPPDFQLQSHHRHLGTNPPQALFSTTSHREKLEIIKRAFFFCSFFLLLLNKRF